jgi:hypothetical protein
VESAADVVHELVTDATDVLSHRPAEVLGDRSGGLVR